LSQQGLDARALEIYDGVVQHHPRHAPAHHGRGLALAALGNAEEAYEAQMRAVALAPDFPDALGALAVHATRRLQFDAAAQYAQRALSFDPTEPSAILTLAFLDVRRGASAMAIQRLQARLRRGGLTPLHVSALESLLAEALDKTGDADAALRAYRRSHSALWSVYQPVIAKSGLETGAAMCRRLQTYFEAAPKVWTQVSSPAKTETATGAKSSGDPRIHVFLVGFVRSGTTLLEQVLAGHPDVVALEEQPLLRDLGRPYLHTDEGLDRLATLDASDVETLRSDYWNRVQSFGLNPSGKVFIDKNPLDIIWAPLIAKLFPTAKVLFVRRDPRDVVVSTLRHRFKISALTSDLIGLEQVAQFYSNVMALTEIYHSQLNLNFLAYRHEDLVDDFDSQVAEICAFIGLDWVDGLRDFPETAKRRDIRTPSADQVRKPLSRDGIGRWRRYRAAIATILPILTPWVEAFGYRGAADSDI
jgi:hypothetical protein